MAAIPFAFSAHHFISTVGADAGFAAIIGLAILVLLFFAQARETASLRQRAAESDEQLRRLAAYVDQLSRSGAAATPAPGSATIGAQPRVTAQPRIAAARMGTGAPVASASPAAPVGAAAAASARAGGAQFRAGAGLPIPAAPAGVGAPALSAATRLIPLPEVEPVEQRSAGPATAAMSAEAGAAVMAPPGPPPSTAAAGANGSGANPGTRPPRLPGAAPAPVGAGTGGVPTTGGQPRAVRRNDAASPTRPPAAAARRPAAQSRGGRRISRAAIAGAALLVAAIVVAAVLVLNSSGTSNSPKATSSAAAGTTKAPDAGRRRGAGVVPSMVTVAVLNGTSTNNLAHDVLSKLTAVGYKPGPSTNASSQTLTSTIVGYLPGHRSAAVAVARSLKLAKRSVQPVDQSNRAVACGGASPTCSAQVIVAVGSDLASLA